MNTIMNSIPQPETNYRACGQTVECGCVWVDYEAKCAECGQWTTEYGEAEIQQPDGSFLPLCNTCAAD